MEPVKSLIKHLITWLCSVWKISPNIQKSERQLPCVLLKSTHTDWMFCFSLALSQNPSSFVQMSHKNYSIQPNGSVLFCSKFYEHAWCSVYPWLFLKIFLALFKCLPKSISYNQMVLLCSASAQIRPWLCYEKLELRFQNRDPTSDGMSPEMDTRRCTCPLFCLFPKNKTVCPKTPLFCAMETSESHTMLKYIRILSVQNF
jgi:hypothetical protein